MQPADSSEDAKRTVREYVEAIGREDFEAACGYLCRAGRVLARAQAKADGLDTDDCAAALAFLTRRQIGDSPPPEAAVAAFLAGISEVELLDSDHAVARLDGPGNELPLVREDGEWRIGVIVGRPTDPQSAHPERPETPPGTHVRHRRRRKR